MLDANIPKAIYAIDRSKNPKSVTKAVLICGCPKYFSIPKYINVKTSHITIIIVAAKNFPKTIEVILLGDVYKICSVPFLRSSANILIVNIGTAKVNTVAREPNIYSKLTRPIAYTSR